VRACERGRVALLSQPAQRMQLVVLSSVAFIHFHHIFRHYLRNSTVFGKKLLNIKCMF
jgi:hypothetical protein